MLMTMHRKLGNRNKNKNNHMDISSGEISHEKI